MLSAKQANNASAIVSSEPGRLEGRPFPCLISGRVSPEPSKRRDKPHQHGRRRTWLKLEKPKSGRPRVRFGCRGQDGLARPLNYRERPDSNRRVAMDNLAVVEIKAFVPARDFALSQQFYQDLGFTIAWSSGDLAYVRHGNTSFLLQNFYVAEHAGNFMMHLLVEDVDAWWRHVEARQLQSKYQITLAPPADRPWGLRDFVISDPTGVLWRIGQSKRP